MAKYSPSMRGYVELQWLGRVLKNDLPEGTRAHLKSEKDIDRIRRCWVVSGIAMRSVAVSLCRSAIYLLTLLFAGLGLFMMVNQDARSLVIFGGILMLLLVLFHVVGAVRLRKTFKGLQAKYRLGQSRKRERITFEDLQLRFRGVADPRQWWQAICEAAERMDFAWVSLKTTEADGRITEEIWRGPNAEGDLSQIVTMRIPFGNGDAAVSREFEIAIQTNGSLEAASRRATLFGKLLDERKMAFRHWAASLKTL